MRIESLQLDNFQGFAGTGVAAPLAFGGKNLLVYGENGSGKTCVGRALKGFFALKPPKGDRPGVR